jgi:hypothetical protein
MGKPKNPFKSEVFFHDYLGEIPGLSVEAYKSLVYVIPVCAGLSLVLALSVIFSHSFKRWRDKDPSRLSFFLAISDCFAAVSYGMGRYFSLIRVAICNYSGFPLYFITKHFVLLKESVSRHL